jgi:dTDP-4-dehydrorhamnose reductase
MKRVLITGGTGYLGNELVCQAYEQGFLVAATYYNHAPPLNNPLEVSWLPLDICDPLTVEEGLDIFQPDIVIHTAFRQQPPHLWEVNARGAQHIALAAAHVGARLIHLSSDVIFDGERAGGKYTESDIPAPITDYGKSKADAENLVREACPSAVLVRTSLIYGFPAIDRHTRFVLDIVTGKRRAALFQDEYRCPIFVGDLAAALLELGTQSYQGVLNIAGTECLSRYEFGVLLAQAHGYDASLIPAGWSQESPHPRPRNCALDVRLARQILRTPLRGVREILAEHEILVS